MDHSSQPNTDRDNPPVSDVPKRLPSGHRVLQVYVPEPIFNAAKAKALLLGKTWPQFVIQLLEEAASDLKRVE